LEKVTALFVGIKRSENKKLKELKMKVNDSDFLILWL